MMMMLRVHLTSSVIFRVCMYKMHAQLTLQSFHTVLHSLVLRPIYCKSVHTTTVVLYMNSVSYLAADAKKPRKRRKLNVANEKENSDPSKPQDKLQTESKSSTSPSRCPSRPDSALKLRPLSLSKSSTQIVVLGDNFQDWLCPRRGRHF